jgi:hypothetical protein
VDVPLFEALVTFAITPTGPRVVWIPFTSLSGREPNDTIGDVAASL